MYTIKVYHKTYVVRWRVTQLWNHCSISGSRNFSLLQSIQPVSCALLISCSMDPGERQPRREIGHSLFSSVEEWMKIHLHCSITFLAWTGKFLLFLHIVLKILKILIFLIPYWRSLTENTWGAREIFNKCRFIWMASCHWLVSKSLSACSLSSTPQKLLPPFSKNV